MRRHVRASGYWLTRSVCRIWALKKRARELGLARTKELPWSEAELAILSRYAWMSDERIRLKLKVAAADATRDFRSLPRRFDLARCLSLHYQRVVAADHTVSLGAHAIALPPLP